MAIGIEKVGLERAVMTLTGEELDELVVRTVWRGIRTDTHQPVEVTAERSYEPVAALSQAQWDNLFESALTDFEAIRPGNGPDPLLDNPVQLP